MQSVAESARARAARGAPDDVRAALATIAEYLQQSPAPADRAESVALAQLLGEAARWHWNLGNLAAALDYSERAKSLAQSSTPSSDVLNVYLLRDLAFLKFAAGDCTGAVQTYASAVDLLRAQPANARTAPDVFVALAGLYRQLGRKEDALSVVSTAQQLVGSEPAVARQLAILKAHVALDAFDTAGAAAALRSVRALAESDPAEVAVTARSALIRNDFTTAQRTLTAAISKLPASASAQRASYSEQLGTIEGLRGNYAAAIAAYLEAYRAYPGYDRAALPVARLNYNLGWIRRMVGDTVQADSLFKEALRGFGKCTGADSRMAARVHLERARLYLDMGRNAEAMSDAEAASKILNADPQLAVEGGYALATQSLVLARLGEIDNSATLMGRAIEAIARVRGNDSQDLAPGYDHLAELAYFRRDSTQMRTNATAALRIWTRTGTQSLRGTGRAQSLLAAAAATDGREKEFEAAASGLLDAAQRYLATAQGAAGAAIEELRAARVTVERVLDAGADASLIADTRALDTALKLIQLPQLAQAGAMIGLQAQALVPARSRAAELLRQRAELAAELRALDTRLADVWSVANGDDRGMAAATNTLAEIRRIQGELLAKDRELARDEPRAAELLRPQLADVAQLRALLRPSEALYVQFVSAAKVHGIFVTSAGASYRVSPLSRTILRRNVSRLRRALDLSLAPAERLPFDDAAAMELYSGSLGPFEDQLQGVTELLVVGDDAFQNIPWSVLRSARRAGAGNAAPGQFLAERFAITVLPSAGSLVTLRSSRTRERAALPFIGFGDPALLGAKGSPVRTPAALTEDLVRGFDPNLVRGLEPLPQTADELKRIARILGADDRAVHLQQAATEAAVRKEDLARYRVISFATHGLLAGDFRGLAEPALVLTPAPGATQALDQTNDGLLKASEIAGLDLRADLVLLSACNTGRADGGGGAAGLSGLARAFFAAGARSLVASHWSVSSAATVPLLTTALNTMASRAGTTRSEALRTAMVAMMRGDFGPRYREPAYWGPFVLLGDNIND